MPMILPEPTGSLHLGTRDRPPLPISCQPPLRWRRWRDGLFLVSVYWPPLIFWLSYTEHRHATCRRRGQSPKLVSGCWGIPVTRLSH